ncbi:YafY family protein [Clostridium sp. A1-XYC3]|uniref:YafY family protein n=1 Tax=Clostridium tanneri TaxID=3037988 RepID=A0ABU4JQG6_9CLOT|nr:YafY family protein [Clostridium sp. A1-XYC3]MDW8800341.1 YafY family protein [Clostridium sp. A1-XYC3]
MSKAKKIFDLIMYVNSKKNFTAQDVAYEFNISVRTAHRYLMEISELGVPIYTEQGRNGGYRTLENRILPPIIFDENEALAIFFAFQSLKYYKSLPFDTDIDSASRKLYATLPEDAKNKINRLETLICLWNPKRNIASPFLKDIVEAVLESNTLIIEYVSKSKNKKREVKPIGVYAYDGLWYMPAFDLEKDKVLLFRVDRIASLEVSKKTYQFPMNLIDWFDSYTIKRPVRLHVKLTREGIRQCQSKSWLEPHIVVMDDENGYIDTIIDKDELDFVSNYFLQLGISAKVIEPQEIVDNIKKQAHALINHYI